MKLHWTATTMVVSVAVWVAAAACCFISWRRSGCRRSVAALELLRLTLITLVLLTLNQPEVPQSVAPAERPTLVVLHDESDSMQTQDVVASVRPPGENADNTGTEEESGRATSRLQSATANPAAWSAVRDQMEVVIQPFSSELSNPKQGTDLAAALTKITESHVNLRGIVLVSDGDWNTGESPARITTQLRMQQVPVFAVGVASEQRLPDVELISTDAPTFGITNKTLRIPFRVVSWLPGDRTVSITLEGTRGENVVKVVNLPGMGQVQDTIDWKPVETGDYQLTLTIPVDDDETIADNNQLSFPITIREEALRVLLVESWPRWDYRYLRNALERDPGVDIHCLLFHPGLDSVGGGRGYLDSFPDEQQLFKYDVVFLGDVGVESNQLSLQNCEHLRQLVRSHAGGLVFLPGFRGKQQTLLSTELEDLYPVVMDAAQGRGVGSGRAVRFTLTEAGRRSLLTRLETRDDENENVWSALPGFHWYAAAQRARIGTEVLAVHSADSNRYGRIPLIATRLSGTGKVLFMGTDGAWRWRRGVEDLYHYRFWGQVVRWMAYQRNMSQGETMRLFYSPDRPEAGNLMTLNANVMSASGEPLRDGTVVVQTVAPSGRTHSVRLTRADEDSWGLFTGTFTPEEGGMWQLITTCSETGARLETSISVQGHQQEQIGQPARLAVLKELADVTGGELTTPAELNQLVTRIAELPEPEAIIQPFRLWCDPLWGGGLVLLLGAFWTGRKLAGLA